MGFEIARRPLGCAQECGRRLQRNLGELSLIAGQGGTDSAVAPDASQVDGTIDAPVTSDVHPDAGTDAQGLNSRFCTQLAKTDAHVVFCDDFDADSDRLIPFTLTTDSGSLTTVADAPCRAPPCIQATGEGPDR
jgi:hypothetical protein